MSESDLSEDKNKAQGQESGAMDNRDKAEYKGSAGDDDGEGTSSNVQFGSQPKRGPIVINGATAGAKVAENKNKRLNKMLLWLGVAVLLMLFALAGWYVFGGQTASNLAGNTPLASTTPTPTATPSPSTSPTPTTAQGNCDSGQTQFADSQVGMTFCYPTGWGATSVKDARMDPSDKGSRQVIQFSNMPQVVVGGVSDDWSTSTGRGATCLDPNNQIPNASSFSTDWYGIGQDSDGNVQSAMRNLPGSNATGVNGYQAIESVSNQMQNGVCVQAHKVIGGSRYRVAFAAFEADFSDSSGITTPQQYMDNPNALFTTNQRAQFDVLMKSLDSY